MCISPYNTNRKLYSTNFAAILKDVSNLIVKHDRNYYLLTFQITKHY